MEPELLAILDKDRGDVSRQDWLRRLIQGHAILTEKRERKTLLGKIDERQKAEMPIIVTGGTKKQLAKIKQVNRHAPTCSCAVCKP